MDISVMLWGSLVRMGQTLIAAGPTLIVGWLVAAIFERILGRDGTYRLFGGSSWRQLPQAWLLGMLLPVCSLGVIPIMIQMRRSGISGGTILAFGLTAPLFNPISVMYGLTLSDPVAIFVFCMGSLTVITVMGLLWDWLFPGSTAPIEPLPATPYGIRRIGAVAMSMCQQAFSVSTLYIVIAVAGVGLLGFALPAGCLQRAAAQSDPLAPVTMAGISTLAYITPMIAIVQIASMFQHGNSIAASFTLLVLGAGVNLGMLVWIVRNYRWRPTLIWISCLVLLVLGLSYGMDSPLRPKGVEQADHTHAFDVYCNPFPSDATGLMQSSGRILYESLHPEEIVAGVACLFILAFGGFIAWLDPKNAWMNALISMPAKVDAPSGSRLKDVVLPPAVIAGVSFFGLVLASVVACFLYYPPVKEIRQEMHAIEAEMVGAYNRGNWENLEYWIPIQEDWSNKLVVSAYLRGQPLDRFSKLKLQVYMKKLELLEHAVEDRDLEEAKEFGRQGAAAFQRFKSAIANL
ncbi:MAG: permease [Planctomycetes bacterium]|nr:permease [Planctomycetota bacterium]